MEKVKYFELHRSGGSNLEKKSNKKMEVYICVAKVREWERVLYVWALIRPIGPISSFEKLFFFSLISHSTLFLKNKNNL